MGGDGEVGECSLGRGSKVGLDGLGGLCGFGGFALILSTTSWSFRSTLRFFALIMASALGVSNLFKPDEKKIRKHLNHKRVILDYSIVLVGNNY